MDKYFFALDLEMNQAENSAHTGKIIQVGLAIGNLEQNIKEYELFDWYVDPNEDDATTWNSRRKSCKVVSPWDSFTFSQKADITTVGFPNTKMHDHPLGLTQVTFDNCVVKVRVGHDLDNLLSLGRLGQVHLMNVSSNGWVATNISLLPCCIFLRWISTMQATGE